MQTDYSKSKDVYGLSKTEKDQRKRGGHFVPLLVWLDLIRCCEGDVQKVMNLVNECWE